MQSHNSGITLCKKRILPFLMWLLLASSLVGCSNLRKAYTGSTFINSRGTPPIQSIVWSPTDENKIVATAYTIGQWPAEVYILDLKTVKKQVIAKINFKIEILKVVIFLLSLFIII